MKINTLYELLRHGVEKFASRTAFDMFNGESVPSAKSTDPLTGDVPLGDRRNMAYMGSTVSYGRGRMVVTATGMDTEMGKIAGVLARTEQEETPLQKQLTQLGKALSWLVLGICVFIFVSDLLVAGDCSLSGILKTFMVAVSLAVAAIPEGLATVVTVVLSIGVTRMSRRNAVIRRLTAVETLGCTQVICSDKTGTLTQNKMTVVDHTGDAGQLAAAMALCSDAVQHPAGTVRGEPTEAALVSFAAQCGLPKPRLEQDSPRIAEAPFDSGRKMMSTLHSTPDGVVQYTKGAPDVLLAPGSGTRTSDICGKLFDLRGTEKSDEPTVSELLTGDLSHDITDDGSESSMIPDAPKKD